MRFVASVLSFALVACAADTSGARRYTPPQDGPAASLFLTSDLPVKDARMNLGIYDNAATDCPSRIGYMGYVRRQTSDFEQAVAVPAGRRIQLAPGFSTGSQMCMGLPSYSLRPEPGGTYRIRHLVRSRTEACQIKLGAGNQNNECALLSPEQLKEYCEFEVEQLVGSSWFPVPEVVRMKFDPYCVSSPITADSVR